MDATLFEKPRRALGLGALMGLFVPALLLVMLVSGNGMSRCALRGVTFLLSPYLLAGAILGASIRHVFSRPSSFPFLAAHRTGAVVGAQLALLASFPVLLYTTRMADPLVRLLAGCSPGQSSFWPTALAQGITCLITITAVSLLGPPAGSAVEWLFRRAPRPGSK